ncbi:TPT1 [Mytilus edulis]|uniref:2'-phosphotransferase n=1 Tax=Mytilus edulis TaxID=6550 RepID=A0A8S3R3N4_MYTED|nr:TPT1 [Mytilus edulis]
MQSTMKNHGIKEDARAKEIYFIRLDKDTETLKEASKSYKKELNRSYNDFQMNTAKDLRKLAKSDPKRLWQKLNSININKSNKTDAVKIEDLYEHFKRLSQDEVIEDNSDIDLTKVPPENINRILNSPITEEEILNVVKKLKNNKASGYDGIVNEHIKHTVKEMLTIYHKLFNIVLNTVLNVNSSKTTVCCVLQTEIKSITKVSNSYPYLGLTFIYNGSFATAEKRLSPECPLEDKENASSDSEEEVIQDHGVDRHLSKTLIYVLRHGASKWGLKVLPGGFVYVDELLSRHPGLSGYTLKELTRLVEVDVDKRFTLERDQDHGWWKIKANQGHSIEVGSFGMPSVEENTVAHAYHYTTMLAWGDIEEEGLRRMNRQHIHLLSEVPPTFKPHWEVQIMIDVPRAQAEGYEFFWAPSRAILCPGNQAGVLPVKFFMGVVHLDSGEQIKFGPPIVQEDRCPVKMIALKAASTKAGDTSLEWDSWAVRNTRDGSRSSRGRARSGSRRVQLGTPVEEGANVPFPGAL